MLQTINIPVTYFSILLHKAFCFSRSLFQQVYTTVSIWSIGSNRMDKYFSTRVINIRKLAWIFFKDVGRTAQGTPFVLIMKTNQLTFLYLWYWGMIVPCCQDHTKHTNTLWGRTVQLLYTVAFPIKTPISYVTFPTYQLVSHVHIFVKFEIGHFY
jgi:hypothetical protein